MTEDEARAAALALLPHSDKALTLAELEQYLAAAADLLRGSIDQADFKAYIFPLMFFKRISDVYLEEYAQALDESGGDHEFAAFAENHRFAIPEGCVWHDVRVRTENIGQALQTAFREIEKANPQTLYGTFGNANWTNKDKLPDRKLADLIEHFSTKALGETLDELLVSVAEHIRRDGRVQAARSGRRPTTAPSDRPRTTVRRPGEQVATRRLQHPRARRPGVRGTASAAPPAARRHAGNPKEGETVYDPACGTGGMLIEVIEHVKAAAGVLERERRVGNDAIELSQVVTGIEGRVAQGVLTHDLEVLDTVGRDAILERRGCTTLRLPHPEGSALKRGERFDRGVVGLAEVSMCCTQAQSAYPFGGTPPCYGPTCRTPTRTRPSTTEVERLRSGEAYPAMDPRRRRWPNSTPPSFASRPTSTD
jgi:hypothetical protein